MNATAGNPLAPAYGIAAEFASARDLVRAAEKIRDAGYHNWDVFSPFPIHGMDEAMGMRRSLLGKTVFFGGLAGFLGAAAIQFVPTSFLYPLVVAGKPANFFTVPAFFPIIFELTILASAFTAVIGMLLMNGLPRFHHPLFNWDRFPNVTGEKFFAAIEARDPKFSEPSAREFLESLGATNITMIHED